MLRGLTGFPKMHLMRGLPKSVRRSKFGILGDKSQAGQNAQIIGSRFQDVQSVPAGGVQVLRAFESIGGSLGEFYANKVQVYRQRVTRLETKERVGSKDEKEQWREWKAEFSALIVAAAALPRWDQTTQSKGLLLLNPVTNRQFLTLLKDVKRLKTIAEVTDKLPNTIYNNYGSGIIENRAMF